MGNRESGVVYCTNCGEEALPSDQYCASCGEAIRAPHDRAHSRRNRRSKGQSSASDSRLRALGVTVLLTFGSLVVLGISGVMGLTLGVLFLPPPLAVGFAIVTGYACGFIGVTLAYMRVRGFTNTEISEYLRYKIPTPRQIGVAAVANLGILVILFTLVGGAEALSLLSVDVDNHELKELTDVLGVPGYLVLVILMLGVIGPTEELLYRGVIQNRLKEQFSMYSALAISSIAFTLIHFQIYAVGDGIVGFLIGFLVLFSASLIFGGIYEYTDNLVIPSLIHGLHNTILITILFFGPESLLRFITV